MRYVFLLLATAALFWVCIRCVRALGVLARRWQENEKQHRQKLKDLADEIKQGELDTAQPTTPPLPGRNRRSTASDQSNYPFSRN